MGFWFRSPLRANQGGQYQYLFRGTPYNEERGSSLGRPPLRFELGPSRLELTRDCATPRFKPRSGLNQRNYGFASLFISRPEKCAQRQNMATLFRPFKFRVPLSTAKVDQHLLAALQEIGQIKNTLPFNQRGWCNELGLFVQLREAMGKARLQAGGKYRAQIDAWRDSPEEPWNVTKYNAGNWGALVVPTLHLVRWLKDRQGVPGDVVGGFHSSISMFRATGALHLPQNYLSVGIKTELGQMINTIREHNVADVLPNIRRHVAMHIDDATAWDCLRRVCHLAGEHREALDAALKAAQLAPHDGVIQYEAASIYVAAITNELRSSRGLADFTPVEIKGCTLEVLGLTYKEAYTAMWHHLEAASASSMTGDYRKAAEKMAKSLRR